MSNYVTNDDRWNILIDLVKEVQWWYHQRHGVLLDLDEVYDLDTILTAEDLDLGIAVLRWRVLELANNPAEEN